MVVSFDVKLKSDFKIWTLNFCEKQNLNKKLVNGVSCSHSKDSPIKYVLAYSMLDLSLPPKIYPCRYPGNLKSKD